MERNICTDGKEATNTNRCLVVWFKPNVASRLNGPVAVMDLVYNATKDWINIPNMQMNYQDENIDHKTLKQETSGYGGIKTTNNITSIIKKNGTLVKVLIDQEGYTDLKARLPKYDEIYGKDKCLTSSENGNKGGICPVWLVNYLNSSDYYNETNGKINLERIYGYWLLSSSNHDVHAWMVSWEGRLNIASTDFTYGVRPVINISTSEIQ